MKDKIYLPNLNGVRCIAAFMVVFSQIELCKYYFGLENNFNQIKYFGRLGVTLYFFVKWFFNHFFAFK